MDGGAELGEVRGIVDSTVRRIDRLEDKINADLTALNTKVDLVLNRMAEHYGAGRFRSSLLDWARLVLAAIVGALATHFIH